MSDQLDTNDLPGIMEAWFHEWEAHYEKHFGPIEEPVMHSTDDADPHIDMYQFRPRGYRDYWTLVTGGMSNQSQPLPDGSRHYTELLMYVREPRDWMFGLLKKLAAYPFEQDTFFHWGHTVSEGDTVTAQPSLLTGVILLPPYFEEPRFDNLAFMGDPLHFLWCIPITDAELTYAQEHGGFALAERMEEIEFDIVVDEGRRSIV